MNNVVRPKWKVLIDFQFECLALCLSDNLLICVSLFNWSMEFEPAKVKSINSRLDKSRYDLLSGKSPPSIQTYISELLLCIRQNWIHLVNFSPILLDPQILNRISYRLSFRPKSCIYFLLHPNQYNRPNHSLYETRTNMSGVRAWFTISQCCNISFSAIPTVPTRLEGDTFLFFEQQWEDSASRMLLTHFESLQ